MSLTLIVNNCTVHCMSVLVIFIIQTTSNIFMFIYYRIFFVCSSVFMWMHIPLGACIHNLNNFKRSDVCLLFAER